MSLLLSGCLGRAQLGAAELGAFQTVTTGAGFLPIFPDVGPLKQAEAPKKKKTKKPKKVKKKQQAKKAKKRPALALPVASATESTSCPTVTVRSGKTKDVATSPFPPSIEVAKAEVQSVDTAAERLRETIAEEDELLLLIC